MDYQDLTTGFVAIDIGFWTANSPSTACDCIDPSPCFTLEMAFELFTNKKQEGFVRDQEKAHKMAEVEDEYREMASAFKHYMEDPAAYRLSENERVQKTADDGAFTVSDADDYMELYRADVRPRDLEALGEQMAELHGREHDFENEVKSKPDLALRAVIAWFKLEQRFYQRTYDKAITQIDFGPDEKRSYVVTHVLNQLGAGDQHAAIAEKIHQWLTQSEQLQRMAETELERRKNGTPESIAV